MFRRVCRMAAPRRSLMSTIALFWWGNYGCVLWLVGNKFPVSFESTVRKIIRLQVHVLSHVYRSHWQHLVELQLHPHFNTLVYHVMLFAKQFDLVDAKDSDALEELFERLRRRHIHAMSTSSPPDTDTDAPLPSAEPAEQSTIAVQNSTALSSWTQSTSRGVGTGEGGGGRISDCFPTLPILCQITHWHRGFHQAYTSVINLLPVLEPHEGHFLSPEGARLQDFVLNILKIFPRLYPRLRVPNTCCSVASC